MLTLVLRDEETGLCVEVIPGGSEERLVEWNLKTATEELAKKVAASKRVNPMEYLFTAPRITIVAKWAVE